MRRLISAAGASLVVLAVMPAVAGARPGGSVTCNGTLAPGVYGSATGQCAAVT